MSGLVVGKSVHGSLGDVEATGLVDRGNEDRFVEDGPSDLEALAAIGAIVSLDGKGATNIGKVGERTGGGETLGDKAVGAIRASYLSKTETGIVVLWVIGEGNGAADGSSRGERGHEAESSWDSELHFGWWAVLLD